MQTRYATSPNEVKGFDTAQLRENFLIENLFTPDTAQFVYSHYDRVIIGGVLPVKELVPLSTYDELKADYFLERRELGIINVGGLGGVEVEGKYYTLNKLDCLYIGKGQQRVNFKSENADQPAQFFLLSAPAHQTYPTRVMTSAEASPVELGEVSTSNQRTIYKYIHKEGIQSCQLVMGLTGKRVTYCVF